MPLTPFHLGPILPLKAVPSRWFSLGAFAVVQVAIDLEVLWNLATEAPVLHDQAHSLAGALVVGLACILPSKVGLTAAYRWLARYLERRGDVPRGILREVVDVTWTGAMSGALIGAVTHVALDSLMHPDVHPFAPWYPQTSFWIPGSFGWLHLACAVIGLAGLVLWLRRVTTAPIRTPRPWRGSDLPPPAVAPPARAPRRRGRSRGSSCAAPR